MKGCPYDNTVAEAAFKIIKIEFVKGQEYETLEQLQYKLSDYVNWFNNHCIHSSLGYMTPIEYWENTLKKLSIKVLTIQRTNFYLDGKKTTRKAVKELVGKERLKEMIEEAKETFFKDLNIQNSYFLVRRGMLTIEFA